MDGQREWVQEVRRLCGLSSSLWVDGDGINARKSLQTAQHLVLTAPPPCLGESLEVSPDQLRLEVLAAAGRLFLRAEEPAKALLASESAQLLAGKAGELDGYGRAAVLDAQVTHATEGFRHAGSPGVRDALINALDAVADECVHFAAELPDAGGIAGRAANNALLLRLQPLYEGQEFSDPEIQVQAWLWVGQARAVIDAAGTPEAGLQPVNRQAVDLARRLGIWERAWEAVTQSLRISYQRNERVSLQAKAAHFAWERGNLQEAVSYGQAARTASIAVDLPWVRLYAHQAGVVAAAAGSGSLSKALGAYRTCVDISGHATRPGRAWETAQIALDAGTPAQDIKYFLHRVGFNAHASSHQRAFAAVILADHDNFTAPHNDWDDVDSALLDAPDRARFHLAAARAALRTGRRTVAAVELSRSRACLLHWPGRTMASLNQTSAAILAVPRTSPAQQKVLDLLIEGLSNGAIAGELGISPRTVAVHVQALLRSTAATSRTELAVNELRRRLIAPSTTDLELS